MPGEVGANRDRRLYVGNLPPDIREKDVEDFFYKFGKIEFIDLKTSRGPPYAFVEFVEARDAEDAVRSRDGYDYDGYRVRCEFTRGVGPRGSGGRPVDPEYADRYSPRGGGSFRGGGRGPPGGAAARRSGFRVNVTGLPASGSWQDLKDHMREAGDVCYADVYRDGTGTVEYVRRDDMKFALKKLDDTKFRSHEGETSYVRVHEDRGSRGGESSSRRSRSRSPRSRSPNERRTRGSPTYSPSRRRSRS